MSEQDRYIKGCKAKAVCIKRMRMIYTTPAVYFFSILTPAFFLPDPDTNGIRILN
jgi:hypothetical protein